MTDSAVRPASWRAAFVSLCVGLLVLLAKLAAWWLTGSVALYSDALESVVNVAAALVALVALRYAARPADPGHPWGHGKAEYFSAGVEGALILVAAASIVLAAVGRLLEPRPLEALGTGMLVSLGATGANAVLGVWLKRQGRHLHSPALVADGAHVLADVVTTVGVLLGVALAKATGWWILDPLLAIGVAVQVVFTGAHIVGGAVGGLLDASAPAGDLLRVKAAVERSMAGALEHHDLRARRAGPVLFVELHLVVPGAMTVQQSHDLCDAVEHSVMADFPGAQVTVHVEPESERRGGTSGSP